MRCVPKRRPAETGQGSSAWPRRILGEAFGTFALVFVAVGGDTMAVVSDGHVSTAARAVAPALMVAAMIYAIGDVSGAHLNPVASLAFALKRLIPASWLIPYWSAQLVGALLAALLVRGLFGDLVRAGVSTPHVTDGVAVTIEAILSLFLVAVILGTADRHRIVGPNAALAVGATIALAGLIALPIEGASMNPARSIAPAVVAGDFQHLWIYIVGPLMGGILAVVINFALHPIQREDGESKKAAQGD